MTTTRIPQPPPPARFPVRYIDVVDTETFLAVKTLPPRHNSPEVFWYMFFAAFGLVVGAVLAMVLSGQWVVTL